MRYGHYNDYNVGGGYASGGFYHESIPEKESRFGTWLALGTGAVFAWAVVRLGIAVYHLGCTMTAVHALPKGF